MADALRRRVAALKGYEMRNTAYRSPLLYWTLFDPSETPIWTGPEFVGDIDAAWVAALTGRYVSVSVIPAWDTDANAALALLAGDGLLWTAHTWYDRGNHLIGVYFDADGTEWEGVASVTELGFCPAFAQAACEAWCLWKEAAG